MKVVQIESVETKRLESPRNGEFLYQRPLLGLEGAADNFSLELVRTRSDFLSPRHRHNFDQVRFQLEGMFDFDHDGKMTPGKIGFFPEGTRYGPQTCADSSLVLVLQFGGASGGGFMSKEQLDEGVRTLKNRGVVENGVFTWYDDNGVKHNKDSYEAVWELVFGRKLSYPRESYDRPILMDPANYHWTQTDNPGVFEKFFGTFTERRTTLSTLQMDPGASHVVGQNAILFVVDGTGLAGGHPYNAKTSIHTEDDESIEIVASTTTEMLCISIPPLPKSVPRQRSTDRSMSAEVETT